jgi:[acyl-carrier-protein] S-malonyltransferase
MQQAAEASDGGMLALIGAEEDQALTLCEQVSADGSILVPANFNAPGQIVLSGQAVACERAAGIATEEGLRATPLTVAGAFHSPLMELAAVGLASALASSTIRPLAMPVWSNVTAQLHDPDDGELLRQRLVQQLTSPVRWSQSCSHMIESGQEVFAELAPGTVLRGLMRRIDRSVKVVSHDEPQD